MCKQESNSNNYKWQDLGWMGGLKVEKEKIGSGSGSGSGSGLGSGRGRMKLWMIRATTTVILWTCIVQLTAIGDLWGPRVLKGWPSCFTHVDSSASNSRALDSNNNNVQFLRPPILPPKS